jgi:hypothetical protein
VDADIKQRTVMSRPAERNHTKRRGDSSGATEPVEHVCGASSHASTVHLNYLHTLRNRGIERNDGTRREKGEDPNADESASMNGRSRDTVGLGSQRDWLRSPSDDPS